MRAAPGFALLPGWGSWVGKPPAVKTGASKGAAAEKGAMTATMGFVQRGCHPTLSLPARLLLCILHLIGSPSGPDFPGHSPFLSRKFPYPQASVKPGHVAICHVLNIWTREWALHPFFTGKAGKA